MLWFLCQRSLVQHPVLILINIDFQLKFLLFQFPFLNEVTFFFSEIKKMDEDKQDSSNMSINSGPCGKEFVDDDAKDMGPNFDDGGRICCIRFILECILMSTY